MSNPYAQQGGNGWGNNPQGQQGYGQGPYGAQLNCAPKLGRFKW